MEQANTKAYALLDLTNEKSNYQMTREMHLTGLFPCNDTNESMTDLIDFLKFLVRFPLHVLIFVKKSEFYDILQSY